MTSFQIVGLPMERFRSLFALSDSALAERNVCRVVATSIGVVPDYVRIRLMSVRAYDSAHLMTDAIVCAGTDTASAIQRMFSSKEVAQDSECCQRFGSYCWELPMHGAPHERY